MTVLGMPILQLTGYITLFNITKLQPFYQDLVKAWLSVSGADEKPLSEQCIWYNKNIKVSTINVMSSGLFKRGMRFCSYLFMENGDLIHFKIWQERGTTPREYIRCMYWSIKYQY